MLFRSKDVQKNLYEEGWMDVGYGLCFDCIEGRSSLITKPPLKMFLDDVAKFFGGDVAEHSFGCRSAQFAVMRTISEATKDVEGERIVIADPNSHYSTNIAAEMCGLKVVEPPHTGYPEYKVIADSYIDKIEEIKKEYGKPVLIMATHADPYYGNLVPVTEIGKICQEYEIPYLVNAAYTGGVMPINMKEMNADFLTLSAHKSMSSIGPLGFLVTTYEWSKKAFMTSQEKPDWTGRSFGKKIPNFFGCSIGGLPIISAMFSFPYVKERVNNWPNEVKKIDKFADDLEDLGDIMMLGERPHMHHLMHLETPVFWEISKNHKRRGFFLAEELLKEGIVGVHKGLSKHIKLSVYGLSEVEIEKVRNAFETIIKKYS